MPSDYNFERKMWDNMAPHDKMYLCLSVAAQIIHRFIFYIQLLTFPFVPFKDLHPLMQRKKYQEYLVEALLTALFKSCKPCISCLWLKYFFLAFAGIEPLLFLLQRWSTSLQKVGKTHNIFRILWSFAAELIISSENTADYSWTC